MSTDDVRPADGPSFRRVSTIFAKIALVPFLGGVAVLAYTAGWAADGDVDWLTADACLLITVAVVTLLTPLICVLVYFAIIIPLWLALFVACDDIPFPGWPGRVRTFLRYFIMAACAAVMAVTIPRLWTAPTWPAFKDTAVVGIFMPACAVFWLFFARMEGNRKPVAEPEQPQAEERHTEF